MKYLVLILFTILIACSKEEPVYFEPYYKFKFNEKVRIKEVFSLYADCVGTIVDGYMIKGDPKPMYIIDLYQCPTGKVDKRIKGGTEFLERIGK